MILAGGKIKNYFGRSGGKIILAGGKIVLAGGKFISAGGKIILAGGKIILTGGKLINNGIIFFFWSPFGHHPTIPSSLSAQIPE